MKPDRSRANKSGQIHLLTTRPKRPKRRDCHPRQAQLFGFDSLRFGRSGFLLNVIEPGLVGHQSTSWLSE